MQDLYYLKIEKLLSSPLGETKFVYEIMNNIISVFNDVLNSLSTR
jgi:hypothetical protein